MRFRLLLYMNYLKKMFRSPARMVLTLAGLTLAVVLLVSGLTFSETYLKSKTRQIDLYKKNAAVQIEGVYDYEIYREVEKEAISSKIDIISNKYYRIGSVKYQGRNVNLLITDVRTDEVDVTFLNENLSGTSRFQSQILSGRSIDEKDIREGNRVVVIYNTLAKILYGDEDPVGKILTFPIYRFNEQEGIMEISSYYDLRIIGVIKDNKQVREYLDVDGLEDDEDITASFPVYTPLSLCLAKNETETPWMRITAFCEKDEYYETVGKIGSIINSHRELMLKTDSYYDLKADTMMEVNSSREMVLILVAAMLIVSGICITNTMFFSIKERINEIGIRKSIGAHDHDILAQYIFEGATYGVIAASTGVLISVFLDSLIYCALVNASAWVPRVGLQFSSSIILVAFCVSVMISVIASVIPAIYASRIKIAEAIRFD